MKKALIGAGGFAREIAAHMNLENIIYFVDDVYWQNNNENIFKLSDFNPNEYEVLLAIGDPKERYKIHKRLPKETKYFTFIDPSALILGDDVKIGIGSMICANVVITTNCVIGDHAHLNLSTTIGHDCVIGDFFTTAPGAKISGNCQIKDRVYIGTNASIKEKIFICEDTIIGLNSGVVKNITESGTYIGTPSKKIK